MAAGAGSFLLAGVIVTGLIIHRYDSHFIYLLLSASARLADPEGTGACPHVKRSYKKIDPKGRNIRFHVSPSLLYPAAAAGTRQQ